MKITKKWLKNNKFLFLWRSAMSEDDIKVEKIKKLIKELNSGLSGDIKYYLTISKKKYWNNSKYRLKRNERQRRPENRKKERERYKKRMIKKNILNDTYRCCDKCDDMMIKHRNHLKCFGCDNVIDL